MNNLSELYGFRACAQHLHFAKNWTPLVRFAFWEGFVFGIVIGVVAGLGVGLLLL